VVGDVRVVVGTRLLLEESLSLPVSCNSPVDSSGDDDEHESEVDEEFKSSCLAFLLCIIMIVVKSMRGVPKNQSGNSRCAVVEDSHTKLYCFVKIILAETGTKGGYESLNFRAGRCKV
jgi:hypothetical protein